MSLLKINIKDVFKGISESCKTCDTCCKTYGWLLKKEANKLIKKGYPVVKINKSIFCIDSFKRNEKGVLILDKIPCCRFYGKRTCLIQKDKPLDCKLFPIKVKFYKNSCTLGLSSGCKYVSGLNSKEKNKLYQRIIKFIKKTPKKELNDYLNLMKEINLISKSKRFWMKKLIGFEKKRGYWIIVNLFS